MTKDEKLDLLCGNVQSINDNVIVMKNDMAMDNCQILFIYFTMGAS